MFRYKLHPLVRHNSVIPEFYDVVHISQIEHNSHENVLEWS